MQFPTCMIIISVDARCHPVNTVERVVQFCSNSCYRGPVDSALIQFHAATDWPLLVNYIDCCNTEKLTLKFRELSATRRAFSFARVKERRGEGGCICRNYVKTRYVANFLYDAICILYLARYRMRAGECGQLNESISTSISIAIFRMRHCTLRNSNQPLSLLFAIVCGVLFAIRRRRLPFWHRQMTTCIVILARASFDFSRKAF